MVYYEPIKPMRLYMKHEIRNIEVICEEPSFSEYPWLEIQTTTGRTFYTEKNRLDDMQKYPDLFPLEERRRFAPEQMEDKKEAAPVES